MYDRIGNEKKSMQNKKNKYIAAILAFIGGIFGIHRFYLNQKGLAFLMIGLSLISLGVLSWIISLIDTFFFITMDSDRFDRKYNDKLIKPGEEFLYKSYEKPNQSKAHEKTFSGSRQKRRELKKVQEHRRKGAELFHLYDFEEAIEEFKIALEIDPHNIAANFNIACAYSQIEDMKKSMYHISRAVEAGFDDFDKINNHEKLAYVRIQSEWQEFVENGYILSDMLYDENEDNPQEEQMQNKDGDRIKQLAEEDHNLLERLKKLQEEREKGGISEEDFLLQRKKLMSS